MNQTTITADGDAVVSQIHIAAPPARVFEALTDRGQALQWMGSEDYSTPVWEMDVRVGGKWQFVSQITKGKNAGQEFPHHGEILELDPPRLLAYSWFADWHQPPGHRTMVRWELTASGKGTDLKMTHSGLKPISGAAKGYSEGWPGLVEALKKFAEQ